MASTPPTFRRDQKKPRYGVGIVAVIYPERHGKQASHSGEATLAAIPAAEALPGKGVDA